MSKASNEQSGPVETKTIMSDSEESCDDNDSSGEVQYYLHFDKPLKHAIPKGTVLTLVPIDRNNEVETPAPIVKEEDTGHNKSKAESVQTSEASNEPVLKSLKLLKSISAPIPLKRQSSTALALNGL